MQPKPLHLGVCTSYCGDKSSEGEDGKVCTQDVTYELSLKGGSLPRSKEKVIQGERESRAKTQSKERTQAGGMANRTQSIFSN